MKVECLREKLREAVSLTERMTGKNLTLPILGTILIEAKGNTLHLRATNLEVGAEVEIPVKIEEEGILAVNANIFSNLLNNLQKESKIILKSENDNLSIITPNTSTLIKCLPADDFPIIPRVVDGTVSEVASQDLILGLKSVLFSASTSDIKPEISSVYIYQNEGNLLFVATDSFRLAEKKIPLSNKDGEFNSLIIPLRNVAEIIRFLEGVEGIVSINSNKNQLSLFIDSLHFTSRIIDGVYPDYRQIMPSSFKTKFKILRNDIFNILKLANVFSDKFNQIDFKVDSKDGEIEINSRNQEVGENISKLKVEVEGEEIEMSFNVRYIIDCLGLINTDQIKFQFMEKNRPLLLEGVGDDSFRYIVMPINR